jgi:hypothetical protein
MNLAVSLLVCAEDQRVIDALIALLPGDGRPVFSDEVNPDWMDVYLAIELVRPPDTLTSFDDQLFIKWYETDYSDTTYRRVLERAGATVRFSHMIGDSAISGELDENIYFVRVGDELKPLNEQNLDVLLPHSGLQWKEDARQNVQQLVNYLVAIY